MAIILWHKLGCCGKAIDIARISQMILQVLRRSLASHNGLHGIHLELSSEVIRVLNQDVWRL